MIVDVWIYTWQYIYMSHSEWLNFVCMKLNRFLMHWYIKYRTVFSSRKIYELVDEVLSFDFLELFYDFLFCEDVQRKLHWSHELFLLDSSFSGYFGWFVFWLKRSFAAIHEEDNDGYVQFRACKSYQQRYDNGIGRYASSVLWLVAGSCCLA